MGKMFLMKVVSSRAMQIAPPILLGIAVSLLLLPIQILNPTNISWLGDGDWAANYLGWEFFRQSAWGWPLGSNPRYGLEISNSVVYSDSNPLLALVFKPISSLSSQPFQYFGLWIYACVILQAWFAWLLTGLATRSVFLRLLATSFFVFAPPFWFRFGHVNLICHFLILAALYLALTKNKNKPILWAILLGAAVSVHFYVASMLFVIWGADLWARLSSEARARPDRASILREIASTLVLVGLVGWTVGYFTVGGDVGSGGFGYYRMNLLSPVDPNNWSYVLKDIKGGPGDYEGFNYFGLGVIILALFAIPFIIREWEFISGEIYKRRYLFVVMFLLTCFAVSHNIAIGGFEYHLWLPHRVVKALSILRSSGRFFWPVYYLLLFGLIVFTLKANSARQAAILLSLALAVQIIDTHGGRSKITGVLAAEVGPQLKTSLADSFWNKAGERYAKVRRLPASNMSSSWRDISYFASVHNMSTDAVYLARWNEARMSALRARGPDAVRTGTYDSDTLYVLDDSLIALAQGSVRAQTDMLARIDGLNIVAPGWNLCGECNKSYPSPDAHIRLAVGEKVSFAAQPPAGQKKLGQSYLAKGWSHQEPSLIWSNGTEARIVIPVTSPDIKHIELELGAFVTANHPSQKVSVSLNGEPTLETTLLKTDPTIIKIPISDAVSQSLTLKPVLELNLALPDAIAPNEIGVSKDPRRLAVNLRSLVLK
ncbi:DUF6311 domain-containing protein [Hyphomicrobium methylovorum]|uniref:DUF6311 domain-containing protein n=1 Tax=Hyphomicrobium methylovorum TaxID=84 RepID=UPI0015E74FD8|nr:DUF6311 domain-containing protein [Hyphomicrobium methylovorum]